MKHLEVRQKYSAARRIFNSLLGVSSGDETLHLMFDILHAIGWSGEKKRKKEKRKETIGGKGRVLDTEAPKTSHLWLFIRDHNAKLQCSEKL